MTIKLAVTCCAIGLAVGVGATWRMLRPVDIPAATHPRSAARDRSEHPLAPAVIERTGMRTEDIRRLVAEEVRAALREQAAPAATAAHAEHGEPATPEPSAAFEPARERIAQSIAGGTWTTGDRDWLHGVLGAVNRVERTELIRQLLVAANTGKLRIAVSGPPF